MPIASPQYGSDIWVHNKNLDMPKLLLKYQNDICVMLKGCKSIIHQIGRHCAFEPALMSMLQRFCLIDVFLETQQSCWNKYNSYEIHII